MKKFYVLLMSFACLSISNVFADSPCDSEMPKHQHTKTMQQQNCERPCDAPVPCPSECFLCTNKKIEDLIDEVGLSETQACATMKLQEKYDQEVLSVNEQIECECARLNELKANCAKYSEIRKQKNTIKKLKKTKKEICECYEKQFKALLSNAQKDKYKKFKKCK